jgi:beta-phosphoglucomutase
MTAAVLPRFVDRVLDRLLDRRRAAFEDVRRKRDRLERGHPCAVASRDLSGNLERVFALGRSVETDSDLAHRDGLLGVARRCDRDRAKQQRELERILVLGLGPGWAGHRGPVGDDLRELRGGERATFTIARPAAPREARASSARTALEYFGLPDAEQLVDEYAEHKQRMVIALIEAGQFTAFPDALRFLLAVRAAGIPIAAASSSKNAGLLLTKIRLDTFAAEHRLDYDFLRPGQTLLDVLDADISGRTFKQGKPHPEIFLTAAHELGAPPQACFVVEDAVSGVTAAKAGGMAALAVARADDAELLAEATPDLLVTTLDDVDLDALLDGRLEPAPSKGSPPART